MKKVGPVPERTPSGIPGFDKFVEGGFVKQSVNLIAGGPGSGKTIFLEQFMYNGVVQYKEKGLFVSFEEDVQHLKNDASRFGWDFNALEAKGMCIFVYSGPYTIADIQSQFVMLLEKTKAQRVCIDSLSVFTMSIKDEYMTRKQLFSLINLLKKFNCTVLISSEVVGEPPLDMSSGGGAGRYSRDGVEEFVADSVISLHSMGLGGEADRALRIVKMRQTNHERGPIPMKISEKGIVVSANQ